MANNIFGVSEKALELTEQRSVMLSNNLVNSTTPNYKAKDIDFRKVLKETMAHESSGDLLPAQDPKIMYRIPAQKSLDGNTVDEEIERKNFLANALRYQMSLTFIQNKTHELMIAMKGE